MFVVASAVIEQVTGQKLGDLMRAWIWAPLEMNSTFSTLSAAKNAVPGLDLAKPYRYNELGKEYEELAYMDLSAISGAGFIISSVQDYAKWARALMASPASPPLSKPRLEAILTPRTLMPTEEPFMSQAYALGWETGVYKGEKYFGHSGNLTGFGAEFKLFPDQKFAVVALANAAGTAGFVGEKLAFHLVDEKLGIPEEKRFDWNGKYAWYFLIPFLSCQPLFLLIT
jgi:CubicO group peptidase (beta-lactamase class C family)